MGGRPSRTSRKPRAGFGPLARLILDTTILIHAERGESAIGGTIDDDDDVAVAALTVAELRVGIELAKGARREKRARFVSAVLDAVAIEPYDLQVAEAHAALLAHVRSEGTPRGAHDLIIAATARARDREVISLDRGGFADLPGVSLRDLPD